PGDLVCGQCGEGNDSSRKFCRRCGTSLAVAAAAPPLPWWRRLFRRRKDVVAAGERPMRGRGGTHAISRSRLVVARISKLVVALVVAALAVAAVGPWRQTISQHVKNLFSHTRQVVAPQFNQVTPSGAIATSAIPGHDGSKAVDGLSNTSWAASAAAADDGVGQVLVVTFAHPVDLARVLFTSGDPASLAAQPHPQAVALTFVPAQQATVLNLKNQADPQPFPVDAKGVTQVQIRINSVYPSSTGGHSVSIAEVEFFTKS
ncbi:MAG TPA: zinc ribbon domain-containing protein, partial [Actinomycetota bacterium]|nr:zinc ribbon domain-containing protein [Actinomycetota bacterium]